MTNSLRQRESKSTVSCYQQQSSHHVVIPLVVVEHTVVLDGGARGSGTNGVYRNHDAGSVREMRTSRVASTASSLACLQIVRTKIQYQQDRFTRLHRPAEPRQRSHQSLKGDRHLPKLSANHSMASSLRYQT